MRRLLVFLAVVLLLHPLAVIHAQKGDDALSQREVDDLRDAAFEPVARIKVFTTILNNRQKRIEDLQTKRRSHTDYPEDMHDVLDQFAKIIDELNDNLDDYNRRHRDVRKELPKLIESTGRWSSTLSAVGENDAFKVVRRIAVDSVKDTTDLASSLQTELTAYFTAHPEAAAEEKRRSLDPHAVHGEGAPER